MVSTTTKQIFFAQLRILCSNENLEEGGLESSSLFNLLAAFNRDKRSVLPKWSTLGFLAGVKGRF